ncbi:hypothetical protein ACI3SI_19680, partial [Lactococcus lactis]
VPSLVSSDFSFFCHIFSSVILFLFRSYNAERILKQEGYKVKNLDGAFGLYSKVTKELLD